jgi:hypothetical protein
MSDDFSKKASEAADKAKETFNAGKEKASAFMEEHDVKGKANAAKDKVNEKIKGLAFRGMLERKVSAETRAKYPVLDKLIPLTNYIVCVLAVVVVVLVVSGIAGGGGGSSGGASSGTVNVSGVGRVAVAPASDFTYRLYTPEGGQQGVEIQQYTGNGGALAIPGTIEGIPVIRLGNSAFYGEDDRSYGPGYNITSVVIPASVKEIGMSCFYWIENLRSVTIQGTGVVLEAGAFRKNLNLETLNIPNGDNVLSPRDSNWGPNAFRDSNKLPLAMRSRLVSMGFTDSGF